MSNNHVAPGQGLGFLYQFDRATYRLLSSDISVVEVGIEDIDDVSVHFENGEQIREQDKSVTGDNRPLTDRSEALWKTLHIWANDISIEPQILENTEFHFVTTGEVSKKSLVARINNSKTPEKAEVIVQEIRTIALALRDNLTNFGATILRIPEQSLVKMILKTYVFDNVSASYGGDLDSIQSLRFFPHDIKTNIFDSASGWIKRQIRIAFEKRERLRITKEKFDIEIKGLIRRYQVAPLIALVQPQSSETNIEDYKASGFVQQLDWINCEESVIRDAVIHYICAQNTRIKWADAQLISDTSLINYEEDLVTRWKLVAQRVARQNTSSPILQGQECLDETLCQDTHIDNESMPKQFICGSFHSLTDFKEDVYPRIGWHPNFKELSEKKVTNK